MPSIKNLFIIFIDLGLLAGCVSSVDEKMSETEILYLATAYTTEWSLDSTTIEMQINEASLFCKDIGGYLQVIDTRTGAPREIGRLSVEEIQFLCIKSKRNNFIDLFGTTSDK